MLNSCTRMTTLGVKGLKSPAAVAAAIAIHGNIRVLFMARSTSFQQSCGEWRTREAGDESNH